MSGRVGPDQTPTQRPGERLGPAVFGLVLVLAAVTLATAGAADVPARAGDHEPLQLVAGRLRGGPDGDTEPLADVSAYCLSCHEGSSDGTAAEPPTHPAGALASDHPVDILYPEADPDYRRRDQLEPDLLLLDRRMSCVTCHAHDDRRHALVLTTEQSRLCRACHLV